MDTKHTPTYKLDIIPAQKDMFLETISCLSKDEKTFLKSLYHLPRHKVSTEIRTWRKANWDSFQALCNLDVIDWGDSVSGRFYSLRDADFLSFDLTYRGEYVSELLQTIDVAKEDRIFKAPKKMQRNLYFYYAYLIGCLVIIATLFITEPDFLRALGISFILSWFAIVGPAIYTYRLRASWKYHKVLDGISLYEFRRMDHDIYIKVE